MVHADRGVVIVGAGECGGRAALELRRCGYRGSITLLGDEHHAPYERPPLSKAFVRDIAVTAALVAPNEAYAEAGIDLRLSSRAVSLDCSNRTVMLASGGTVQFDRLLLTTGAVPRRLDVPGLAGDTVLVLRTLADAMLIRDGIGSGARLVIVGAGLIGLELAASAAQRGADVTVVEASQRVMSRGVPAEIASVAAARHRAAGVKIHCGETVVRAERESAGVRLLLSGGRDLATDLVVAAVGVDPATSLAEMAGLAVDNGVAVDDQLATTDPRVHAAGDCCSFPLSIYDDRRIRVESWRNALEQGPLAARNMLGAAERVSSIPWFWSEQHDLTLQVVGLCDQGTKVVRRDLGEGTFVLFHLDGTGRLVAASGIGLGTSIGREIGIAERLILARSQPSIAALQSSEFSLKKLLRD